MALFPLHRGRITAVLTGACTLLALVGCSNNDYGNGSASTSSPAQTSPGTAAARIVIENFTFTPENLRVRPGTKITVVNRDSATHTVTATGDKAFDTGDIEGGATTTFTAPSAPGSYAYICTIHPNMKGTLTVS
ncbi:cupredoxin family copper-binding protein [Streptomyces sp. NPDC051940]|uniref:cupredoxin domain-containing protein n=1 Tax=Streptomyces sp. NPDC051940 TaxID=3155675 RepID=UPI003423F0FC